MQVRDGGGQDALQLDVHLSLPVPQGEHLPFVLSAFTLFLIQTKPFLVCLFQDTAGEPLYKLFKALKHQVEKGPVDAKMKKAKYTLNDTGLLGDDVEYCVLVRTDPRCRSPGVVRCNACLRCQTLQVLVHGEGPDVTPVKVLNCDTITQVSWFPVRKVRSFVCFFT